MRKLVMMAALVMLATTTQAEDGGGTGAPLISQLMDWLLGLFV